MIFGLMYSFIGTDIFIWPTYPEYLCQIFFWKKYGSELPYLPTVWTYFQTFVVFFSEGSPKLKAETSWAGSATLGDTSWARMIFQMRPSISVDSLRHISFLGGRGHRTWKWAQMFLLRIQDRAECGKGTELHWGGHHTENSILGWGDTAHTFLIG